MFHERPQAREMSIVGSNVLRERAGGAAHVLQAKPPFAQNFDHLDMPVRAGDKECALVGAVLRVRVGAFGEEEHELVEIVVLACVAKGLVF